MSLVIVVLGIVLILLLMLVLKLNAFLSLIITSLIVGLLEGLPVGKALNAVLTGVGDTLGSLALILAFGAMLGKILETSGAAQRITYSLIKLFGRKKIQLAIMLTGFLVGLPMIYNAGFLVLIPLVYSITVTARIPLLYLGIPMCAALSATHGLLPPHPAPTAISVLYNADVNTTLLYGILITIPAVTLAGPVLSKFFKHYNPLPPKELYAEILIDNNKLPSSAKSLFVALLPVILMILSAFGSMAGDQNSNFNAILGFIGDPNIALLIAVLTGVYLLGIRQGKKMEEMMQSLTTSVGSIAMIVLIIAAGGAFKQVLLDSGVGNDIQAAMNKINISPILLAWGIAALLRLALGSATVAAITAAGMIQPLLAGSNIQPELMVIATTSGSLMFSHLNDIGFWMFKEYFNLSVKQTFATWTIMETIVSITGLSGALLIHMFT